MIRPPRRIVQAYAPTRRALLLSSAVLIAVLAAYGSYELGRYRAGYDVVAAARARGELKAQIRQRDDTIADLRAQSAELDTLRAGQGRERTEVSRTIGELQAQVARQTQEMAFYKGLAVQAANGPEVKIQQLHIVRGASALDYVIKLTLAQPVAPQNQIGGTVLLSVAGQNGAHADTLDLAQLTAGRLHEQTFTLRYFENLEFELSFPADFRPERLQVEVRPSRRGATPLVQSFIWVVETT